ncbi:aminotransferase class IV [Halobacteriovorax sp. GB3]|uniref:aminotransferase class IV n=1 Tax=Halobacteriovorax sp. GB3 TaxID=2719615 RepID=UPI00235FE022|nr:aminotransferase class IV [Halobacteriovorax sp. GB3]MDD0854071.1 aminotransferase class IV [Halobacteriovorax sp. GB3]
MIRTDFILLDGEEAQSGELLLNRAFLFGESPFTTTRIIKGKVLFQQEHLERLMRSWNYLYGDDFNFEELSSILEKLLLELETEKQYYLRITLFKTLTGKNHSLVSVKEFLEQQKDLSLCLSESRRGHSILPSFLKSGNYLETLREIERANTLDFDDILFLNTDDYILEASFSNVFIVKEGRIITPPEQSGLLLGIVRNKLIHFLKKNSYDFSQEQIHEEDLYNCDEIWLTNSLRFLRCANRFEEHELSNRLFKEIQRRFYLTLGI